MKRNNLNEANNKEKDFEFDPNAGDKMKVIYEVGINGENSYSIKPEFTNEEKDGDFTLIDAVKSTAMINFSHLINLVTQNCEVVENKSENDDNSTKKVKRVITKESIDAGFAQYANFVSMRRAIELEWIENWLKNLSYRKEVILDEVTISEAIKLLMDII